MDCWFVGLLLCTLVLGATRSLGYQPRGGIQDFLVNSGSILGHPVEKNMKINKLVAKKPFDA